MQIILRKPVRRGRFLPFSQNQKFVAHISCPGESLQYFRSFRHRVDFASELLRRLQHHRWKIGKSRGAVRTVETELHIQDRRGSQIYQDE